MKLGVWNRAGLPEHEADSTPTKDEESTLLPISAKKPLTNEE